MSKSERQKAKELKKLETYLNLVHNEGKTQQEAADIMGVSLGGLHDLRRRYITNDFETSLKENGFDPHTWDHGWLKLQGSSIHIKNQENIVTYDDIREEMISAMKAHAPSYPKIKRKKIKEGHLLVISLCDVHVGKLAVKEDSGESYDIETAVERGLEGVEGLINKSSGFEIDQILLMIGHDILHTDNLERKTTAGTRQDTDGSECQAYVAARKLYVDIVEVLLPIAPVHVVHSTSNHDYLSGSHLADSLFCWFHNNKDVSFETSRLPFKFYQYGESMIGMNHGDGIKGERHGSLMAELNKKMWAETTYRYWYMGHVHHKVAKEEIGVTVEYVRSPSSADAWHTMHGYISKPAIEGFVHNKKEGQICRLTHYVS